MALHGTVRARPCIALGRVLAIRGHSRAAVLHSDGYCVATREEAEPTPRRFDEGQSRPAGASIAETNSIHVTRRRFKTNAIDDMEGVLA